VPPRLRPLAFSSLPPAPARRRACAPALAAAALALAGCQVPVAAALAEDEANRVVVALDRGGVETAKESDPQSEGRFRVLVPREDAARALSVLRDEELPPRPTPGVLDAVGKSSLVPSVMAERAQYVAGLAGDLERTLSAVDGVIAARVHLSVAEPGPLGDKPPTPSTASVLLKYRGANPPVDVAAVQHLVAGAVSGLRVQDVSVVLLPRPSAPAPPERQLAHFGPLAVTRGTMPYLRGLVAVVIVSYLAGLGALANLWVRLQRARRQPAPAQARP
jgi:type III secretion protein J